jgi:hypothetical protein
VRLRFASASKKASNTPARLSRQKRFQIVCTQSTKRLAFALWAGGEDVADLNSAVRHNNAVDQKLEQRTLAFKVGSRQAVPYASAEDVGVGCERDCLRARPRSRFELLAEGQSV